MMPSVFLLPAELIIFLREHEARMYRVGSYNIAKVIASTPQEVVFPIVFCTVLYFMVGYQSLPSHVLTFYACMILLSNVSSAMGATISAMAPNPTAAISIFPAIIVPLMLFAGLFSNLETIPAYIRWVKHISLMKYGYEILVLNELEGMTFDCNVMPCFSTGEQVIENYGFGEIDIPYSFAILTLLYVVFRILSYAFLYRKARLQTA